MFFCLASPKHTVNVNLFGFTDMAEEGRFLHVDVGVSAIWC